MILRTRLIGAELPLCPENRKIHPHAVLGNDIVATPTGWNAYPPSLLLAKEKLASEAIRKLVEKLGLEIVALRE